MVYDVNENSFLFLIYQSSRISLSSSSSITRAKKILVSQFFFDILLPIGSFDEQCQNLNIFLLSSKILGN